ncbi:hypothetical protein [Pseudonocardia phyllosphaerae]
MRRDGSLYIKLGLGGSMRRIVSWFDRYLCREPLPTVTGSP